VFESKFRQQAKNNIFTKEKTHETKMADFNLRRCSTNSFRALHLLGKMYAFLVPPCQKTFLKTNKLNTLGQKQYSAVDVGEKC